MTSEQYEPQPDEVADDACGDNYLSDARTFIPADSGIINVGESVSNLLKKLAETDHSRGVADAYDEDARDSE